MLLIILCTHSIHIESLSQSRTLFTLHLIMTFTHGIHFLSLLEQPKDSMGGGYASKHESTDVGVETAINPTEPVTNGHQDDSSLPASAELTNGHKVEESTDATETVTHGSKADVHPESEESNITLGSVDVALPEEPETHVPTGVASSVPDSDESNIALGSVDVASPEEPETHVPSGMVSPVPASTKLQRLLKGSDDLIVCPGVYDGFSARIAMSVGFQCLYMVWYFPSCRFLMRVLNFRSDRCRYHSFALGNGRSWRSAVARHAGARRDDRQPGPSRPTSDCRHGHRLWW